MVTRKTSKIRWPRWIVVSILVIVIRIFSTDKGNVEYYYTNGIYPPIAKTFRLLFGWIPFSLGDILYILAGFWILFKVFKNVRLLFKNGFRIHVFLHKIGKTIFLFLIIYLLFNIFWGLNYDRRGIDYELKLSTQPYDTTDLKMVENLLIKKVNSSKSILIQSGSEYPNNAELFKRAAHCYQSAEKKYPFLDYQFRSVKASMYGWLGNYLGFTGYYNPFTGEAQVNTTVPKFMHPYIVTHEMGHQLGYGKEDAANFAGYLAAANSSDALFHYSTYLDLFIYANREIYFYDSVSSRRSFDLLIAPVREDIEKLREFSLAHRSYIEPAIDWMYGKYLKLNRQPKGLRSYNEVISMLIAYYKKYGTI